MLGRNSSRRLTNKEIPEGKPKMNLRVIALSNSKNDFDEDGIDLKAWQSAIDKGESADQNCLLKK
jgi:hypothetical protein